MMNPGNLGYASQITQAQAQAQVAQAQFSNQAKPANPRLVDIRVSIDEAATQVLSLAQRLSDKADSVFGMLNTGAAGAPPPPAAVPNGALEGIEASLRQLHSAIELMSAAERRFLGLA